MISIQISSFCYRTDADAKSIVGALASQGAKWINSELISSLVRINAPGGDFIDRNDYDPSLGVCLSANQTLVLYRAKRELERGTSGRSLILKTFWVVNPKDTSVLHLCFGSIRKLLEPIATDTGLSKVIDFEIQSVTDTERLTKLLTTNSSTNSSTNWYNAWLYLVQQLSLNKAPVSIPDLRWTQDAILDLAEAVTLALPLSWRERASFATSMLDIQPKVPALKFAPQNKSVANPAANWPSERAGTGDPKTDYTRLLADAYKEYWLPQLMEEVALLKDNEVGANAQDLLNNLYPKISEHYASAEDKKLVESANEASTIGELVKSLPLFSAIDAAGQTRLQQVLCEKAHNLLAGGNEVKPDQLISLLSGFRWLESNEVRLVRDILQYMNEKASLDDQKAIMAGLKDKHPAEVSSILSNPLKYPELEQYIVLATYQEMKPTDKGNNRYYVSVKSTGHEWWIKRGQEEPVIVAPETGLDGLAIQPWMAAQKDNKNWVAIRRYLPGESFEEKTPYLTFDQKKEYLLRVAAIIDELHKKGFLFGALKASNIIITESGPVLVDGKLNKLTGPVHGKEGDLFDLVTLSIKHLAPIEKANDFTNQFIVTDLYQMQPMDIVARIAEAAASKGRFIQIENDLKNLYPWLPQVPEDLKNQQDLITQERTARQVDTVALGLQIGDATNTANISLQRVDQEQKAREADTAALGLQVRDATKTANDSLQRVDQERTARQADTAAFGLQIRKAAEEIATLKKAHEKDREELEQLIDYTVEVKATIAAPHSQPAREQKERQEENEAALGRQITSLVDAISKLQSQLTQEQKARQEETAALKQQIENAVNARKATLQSQITPVPAYEPLPRIVRVNGMYFVGLGLAGVIILVVLGFIMTKLGSSPELSGSTATAQATATINVRPATSTNTVEPTVSVVPTTPYPTAAIPPPPTSKPVTPPSPIATDTAQPTPEMPIRDAKVTEAPTYVYATEQAAKDGTELQRLGFLAFSTTTAKPFSITGRSVDAKAYCVEVQGSRPGWVPAKSIQLPAGISPMLLPVSECR